jgi:hypothetical protein
MSGIQAHTVSGDSPEENNKTKLIRVNGCLYGTHNL